mmetsp:Transcript_45205/g.104789  ORF Transcript_45205/g.104789 Transcript_45205/m.104789 type:complete len:937 (-) Transcript_45205:51-2861(-)
MLSGIFGWPTSVAQPRHASAHGENEELSDKLLQLISDDDNPLVQPLKNTLKAAATYGRALHEPAVCDDLHTIVTFLRFSENLEKRMEFALATHSDEHADLQTFSRCVERVLRRIMAPPGGYPAITANLARPAAEDALTSWHAGVQGLQALCKQVWEQHFYLVFLETKGDRVLFEQTARSLCSILEIPVRSLSGSLVRTKKWVDSALDKLAIRGEVDLLCRCHSNALRDWLKTQESENWKADDTPTCTAGVTDGDEEEEGPDDEARMQESIAQGTKFWEVYFTHLFKITWPDFVEAFENFYLVGHCPLDVVAQLRLRVDPGCRYQVLRDSWQQLLRDNGRIRSLVRKLVQEVTEDVGSRVYRPETLRPYPPLEEVGGQSPRSPAGQGRGDSAVAAPARARPWFPFAHSLAEDNDMAIPTPHETPQLQRPDQSQQDRQPPPTMAWDDWVASLCSQSSPWWIDQQLASKESEDELEPRRVAALRAVNSSMAYTRRALVFRVVVGDLGQNSPILELPTSSSSSRCTSRVAASEDEQSAADVGPKPCLVVTANGTRFNGVTKFGRGSSRRTLLPDCPMSEPIASRSHFNVVYQQESDRYFLMDAGSKWGTFVKIGNGITLSCGDWIRVGGVEFIVRYCGGRCACQEKHAHYRLHSLRLLREHTLASSAVHFAGSGRSGMRGLAHDSDSDEAEEQRFEDELVLMLSSRRPCGWTTSSARLCQHNAMRIAGLPEDAGLHMQDGIDRRLQRESVTAPPRGSPGSPVSATMLAPSVTGEPRLPRLRERTRGSSELSTPPTQVPIEPLELDFISGPRMGEKLVLSERICTLGRGEGNTIQVNDSQLVSVSRVHCIFEYRGDRWHMRDNSSTNGTWKRLSCVLEPSDPVPLHGGISIQAGVHEFLVEEAEMRDWWVPSMSVTSFDELCVEQDVRVSSSQTRSRQPST